MIQACVRQGPFAPRSLPASSLLRTPPTSAATACRLPGALGSKPMTADLPGSLTDLLARAAPNHPGKPGCCTSRCLHSRWQAAHSLGGRPLPTIVTRPNRVQCLRPAPSTLAFRRATTSRWSSAAPTGRSPSSMARRSTCRASDSHGQHLTVDKISQAWPGAPESAEIAERLSEGRTSP